MTTRRTLQALFFLFPLWGFLMGGGMLLLNRYETSPSPGGHAPAQWPNETGLVLGEKDPTLVLFVHPYCPCTNATAGELERLVTQLGDGLTTYVIFLHPRSMPAEWHRTPLWTRIHSIPGVHVIDDLGSQLTRRFGAVTSGEAYLYSASGRLQFVGGITGARGHSGDNPGSDAILSLVSGRADSAGATPKSCPVFGCPLFEKTEMAHTAERER